MLSFGAIASCQTCGCAENSCGTCQTPSDRSNCSLCCCTPTHQSWRQMRIGSGVRVEILSSAWMTVEVLSSVGLGLMAGSFALLAFGGDSLIELISGFAVLNHLRKDAADQETQSRRTESLTTALLF